MIHSENGDKDGGCGGGAPEDGDGGEDVAYRMTVDRSLICWISRYRSNAARMRSYNLQSC